MLKRIRRLFRLVIGAPKNPLDPHVFRQVSLVAFLAWVGLGADGLSSSCYGPEEAFLALGPDRFLAPFLVLATALTVFIISASYSQIIELFPTGGGGYLVASKLLGARAGLVSGCALLVDYVLTIAISISSGTDAIFSFLPLRFQQFKLVTETFGIGFLILLNLRGVKESVTFLVPIFMGFLVTHVVAIAYGVWMSAGNLAPLAVHTGTETMKGLREQGLLVMLGFFLHAYSMGAGTYTGIEAVSNGLPMLREPRVHTGKRTMLYMSTSLAFTAGGILLCYLLLDVHRQEGRTLNAVLLQHLVADWNVGGWHIGQGYLLITLLFEGMLLFVAAQTGFLDGPRVLASMAVDSWVPHRFYQLSDRLVTKNGTLLMGAAALAILYYTRGDVRLLVVFYSINVFLTFTLSQLGMCLHWWEERNQPGSWSRLGINGIGLLLTSAILIVTLSIKFAEGGWVTAVVTSSLIAMCLWIRHHYDNMGRSVRQLDTILSAVPSPPELAIHSQTCVPTAPTAVLLVTAYNGLGIHSFLSINRLFAGHFRQFVFVSAGVIDSSRFKGATELDHLKQSTEDMLRSYVTFANSQGLIAASRYTVGTDTIDMLVDLCKSVAKEFPRSVFFTGKLIFQEETLLTRLLHNQAALAIQRRLQFAGLQTVVLPVRAM